MPEIAGFGGVTNLARDYVEAEYLGKAEAIRPLSNTTDPISRTIWNSLPDILRHLHENVEYKRLWSAS